MATKSYADRIKTTWGELSPEEIGDAWARHEACRIMHIIQEYPPECQEAIFNAVIEGMTAD